MRISHFFPEWIFVSGTNGQQRDIAISDDMMIDSGEWNKEKSKEL